MDIREVSAGGGATKFWVVEKMRVGPGRVKAGTKKTTSTTDKRKLKIQITSGYNKTTLQSYLHSLIGTHSAVADIRQHRYGRLSRRQGFYL